MANKIQFKRGVKANLPTLSVGEPAFTTDTNDFFIGNGTSNIQFAKQSNLDGLKSQIWVNVKSFGAKGDGITNDTESIQNAINSLSTGGTIYFPKGVYNISSTIIVPQKIFILGEGIGTTIRPMSSIINVFNITGSLTKIENLSITNQNNYATNGISINKSADNLYVTIRDLYISSFSSGILWNNGDRAYVENNSFVNNTVAFKSLNDCRNSVFSRNYILGGSGFDYGKVSQGVEGIVISENHILNGNTGTETFGLSFNGALSIDIIGNVFDQIYNGNGINLIGTNINCIKIYNCWFGANASATIAKYGVFATYGSGIFINGCTFTGFNQAGIYLKGISTNIINKVSISNCEFYYADVNLRDIQIEYVTNILISCCMFSGTANIVEGNNCSGMVEKCAFTIIPTVNNLKYYEQLSGIVVKNRGVGTIAGGSRTCTVTHGLSFAPNAGDINITLSTVPSNSMGQIYIDNITATSFRVVTETAVAYDVPFSWKADTSQ